MSKKFRILNFAFCILLLAGCSKPAATPRPVAWPRLELGQAVVEQSGPGELDVRYPSLGATLYLSSRQAQSADELSDMVDNRLERIRLDAAGAPIATRETASGVLFLSPEAPATPLHFLAYDDKLDLQYAVLVMDRPIENFDSIAPLIDSISVQIPRFFSQKFEKK